MVSIHTGLSALNAFATGVQGTAYNIANINTAGFQPVSVDYRSGRPADQGKTLRALGLGKIGRTVDQVDNESVRGMIFKVKHLITVEEI